jgi:acyl dehydratase
MRVYASIAEFAAAAGDDLGTTDWIEIDQERIDRFADATGDHQWIHVDPERAASGPFGGTIAHGFLTLSMLPVVMGSLYRVDGISMAVNYGLEKVRFPAPVPVGSKLRGSSSVTSTQELDGAVQGTITTTIEVDGSDRPACVVQSIVRYYA